MDVAFSLIKRDYIFAANCNYDDTANLQTRCPFCYEPVFLKAGSTKKNHFAHYSESLNSADCELRAKSYYSNYSEFESETKGQTLLKHYRIFSNLYAVYMGVPKDIILYSAEQINDLINPTIDIIKQGTAELEIELQRENMKDFLSLSLKILLNAIINQNLQIPAIPDFYALYKESIQDFLNYTEKRILDYEALGKNLLLAKLQKLKEMQNEDYSQQLFEQITNNKEYVINTLSTRFSVSEMKIILFGGIIKKNTDILNCLNKLRSNLIKKYTEKMQCVDGKEREFLSTRSTKYIYDIDPFKISLFLGQENVVFYTGKNKKNKQYEDRILLINQNINFFERLSKIKLFSTSEKSDFFKCYTWGPIIKRNYGIYRIQNPDLIKKEYLKFYSDEKQKHEANLLKRKQQELLKQEQEEKAKLEESKKNPVFIIHKKSEIEQEKKQKMIVCKFCKKEILANKLILHLKKEHPKTN